LYLSSLSAVKIDLLKLNLSFKISKKSFRHFRVSKALFLLVLKFCLSFHDH